MDIRKNPVVHKVASGHRVEEKDAFSPEYVREGNWDKQRLEGGDWVIPHLIAASGGERQ